MPGSRIRNFSDAADGATTLSDTFAAVPAGSIIVVCGGSTDPNLFDTPTDDSVGSNVYTKVFSDYVNFSTYGLGAEVWWKEAHGDETQVDLNPASGTSALDACTLMGFVLASIDAADPYDTYGQGDTATGTGISVSYNLSQDTAQANSFLTGFCLYRNDNLDTWQVYGTPDDFDEDYDVEWNNGNSSAFDITGLAGTGARDTVGDHNTFFLTFNTAAEEIYAVTIAWNAASEDPVGDIDFSIGGVTSDGNGTYDVPGFVGAIDSSLQTVSSDGLGDYDGPPAGFIEFDTQTISSDGSATYDPAPIDSDIDQSLATVSSDGNGAHVPPNFQATAVEVSLPTVTTYANQLPVVTGSLEQPLPMTVTSIGHGVPFGPGEGVDAVGEMTLAGISQDSMAFLDSQAEAVARLQADAQSLEADGKVDLFEIAMVGGATLYLKNNDQGGWQGNTYESWGIGIDGVGVSAGEQQYRPKLTLANPEGIFSALVSAGDLDNATVTRIRILRGDFEKNRPFAKRQSWKLRRLALVNDIRIVFECRDHLDGQYAIAPARMFIPPEFPQVSLS